MTSFIVQVDSQEEIDLLKSLLKENRFSFKTISDENLFVSEEELHSINKGVEEAQNGLLKDSVEVHQAARAICSE